MMKISRFNVSGPLLIEPRVFEDERGVFLESWNRQGFRAHGIDVDFVQDSHSCSAKAGTLRGLHFQAPPHAQDKLVRCTRGAIHDVAIDIRRGSQTYGQAVAVELTAENRLQLYIPKGFLHGFLTLDPDTEVQYKSSEVYRPACEGSVCWDSLDLDWPLQDAPILSARDAAAAPFDQFESPFTMGEDT